MELVPYKEFSALHIRDFLPSGEFWEDDAGLEQSILGFNRSRYYFMAKIGWLFFHYPDNPPTVLAGIDVSLVDADLPPDGADRVLGACAPVLRFRMKRAEAVSLLGQPDFSKDGLGEGGFYRFRVGQRWPYRVGCHFHSTDGLVGFWIVREDYFAED